ncbi:MAG: hypothetical protein MZU95_02955 [Desulfomicrobium escambiense]|nr:hypothetical protein [Desulfomicrobium escambiense]
MRINPALYQQAGRVRRLNLLALFHRRHPGGHRLHHLRQGHLHLQP